MFKLSKGNSKIGLVINANLPAVITCRKNAPCIKDCYARKGFYNMPSVQARYAENLQQWQESKQDTFDQIQAQLPKKDREFLFRWHSSGDIPDKEYFAMMVAIAVLNPNGRYLAFTKKWEIVNDWLDSIGWIPDNLNIVFSTWEGLEIDNRHNLPITRVSNIDSTCPAQLEKGVNCDNCGKCWYLKEGQEVVFKKH